MQIRTSNFKFCLFLLKRLIQLYKFNIKRYNRYTDIFSKNKAKTTTKIYIICIGSLIKGPGTSNTFCVAWIYSRLEIS